MSKGNRKEAAERLRLQDHEARISTATMPPGLAPATKPDGRPSSRTLIQMFGHLKAEDILAEKPQFVYAKDKEPAFR